MPVKTVSGTLMVLLLSSALAAQQNSAPSCATAAHRQFDFWVGDWDLTWPAQGGQGELSKPGHGTNRIQPILDDCVILENFDGTPSVPLKGMSVSTYNPRDAKWRQTWVDSQGGYLDFVGGFKDDQMILSREATGRDGKKFLQRMVWKNIQKDSLDWSWERSDDGGKTWKVVWPIHYERKRTAAAE